MGKNRKCTFEVTGFGKRMKYHREDTKVHRSDSFTLAMETGKKNICSAKV